MMQAPVISSGVFVFFTAVTSSMIVVYMNMYTYKDGFAFSCLLLISDADISVIFLLFLVIP